MVGFKNVDMSKIATESKFVQSARTKLKAKVSEQNVTDVALSGVKQKMQEWQKRHAPEVALEDRTIIEHPKDSAVLEKMKRLQFPKNASL